MAKNFQLSFKHVDVDPNRFVGSMSLTGSEAIYMADLKSDGKTYDSNSDDFEQFLDEMYNLLFMAPFSEPWSICTWVYKDSTFYPTVSQGDCIESDDPTYHLIKHVSGMADGLPIVAFTVRFYNNPFNDIWSFVA